MVRQFIFLFAGMFLLSGCGGSAVRTASISSPAATSGSNVNIYMSTDQVGQPYKEVGIVEYYNIGKFQNLSVVSIYEGLREKARELGANGVIIDEYHTIYSGIISRGISATGRAIITR